MNNLFIFKNNDTFKKKIMFNYQKFKNIKIDSKYENYKYKSIMNIKENKLCMQY